MTMTDAVTGQIQVGNCVVRLIRGDITDLDVDAFVFYAQHDLALGSGFGTAISTRGGPSIQKELEGLGPLETGQAIATGAGDLKAGCMIHAVGPRFSEDDTEAKLRTTVNNALRVAEERGVKRLALPAMGAGFYGVPLDVCARVMVQSIVSHLEGETGIQEVVLCVTDRREYAPFESELSKLDG